jgi:glycosyltransferase involved in cell wall biosynthesis
MSARWLPVAETSYPSSAPFHCFHAVVPVHDRRGGADRPHPRIGIESVRVSARFSLVVPVHNEAPILADSLSRMVEAFDRISSDYEIFICENGSTDDTQSLIRSLERIHSPVRAEYLPTANYGLALKHGIAECRHELIVLVNIDFWNVDFVRRALPLLADGADLVVGSKVMAGSNDARPRLRRVITRSFNALLHRLFDFRGTDTHGMKALRKSRLAPIAGQCVTDRSLFDTELVLRAERQGLHVVEIPVDVHEIRQPDYWSMVRRIPETFINLWLMIRALWRR